MSLLTCANCRLVDKKNARRYDDCLTYSVVAAKKALKQAGLDKADNADAYGKLDLTKAGVLIGSGMGGLTVFQDGVKNLWRKATRRSHRSLFPMPSPTCMHVSPAASLLCCIADSMVKAYTGKNAAVNTLSPMMHCMCDLTVMSASAGLQPCSVPSCM